MPHFFIKNEEIKNNHIELFDGENLFHLVKVLRVKIGEKIKFIDKNQTIYNCSVEKITKNSLIAKIVEQIQSERYLKSDLCLIQAVLMNDAQNLAVANAVQTGVKEIYPVISDNVSVSINKAENKVQKWEKIAYENFKQCERADIPKIHNIQKLYDVLKLFKKENILIFAEKYENADLNNCLNNIDIKDKIAVVIGPEGGFSKEEFDFFIKENYKLITLGKMIYKAPNAITCAISNIVSRIEK